MFEWYYDAELCLAHLADVETAEDESSFEKSEWFERGWTLQELLAPPTVLFVTKGWHVIGHKGQSACRGFSRSYLTDAQDYAHRLATDADDAALLIQHLSPSSSSSSSSSADPATATATVIGNSSGAIVALELLVRHPQLIRTLVSYEPPLARLLPDFDDIWATHERIYATYRAAGAFPAYEMFGRLIRMQMPPSMMMTGQAGPYGFANTMYWFEREFMTYPQAEFDVGGALAPQKGKLVLVNGELSDKEAYQYRGNVALGQRLGVEVLHVPGEHVGHRSHAEEFGGKLVEVLKGRDEFYARL
ncbi:hypothetical protein LTR59_014732 [Friedmanniomyces endolithicus]|nr:hypothetical protein LTR94_017483 [Friedmanniomyces endolithicus]KAK0774869.1 hypothetical protein LTR59_014732 [Friedmanniomyces endolithicus]KAK0778989.1 hypothetical protein LTR38_014601 [Friedmanniomyces endolithicus]KAK0782774.1 hypothetical protein LTR75_014313 [Friedmanniomyces endolithicus]